MSNYEDDGGDHLSGNVNPWVMSAFITYSTLLLVKMLLNTLLVVVTRMRTQIFSNPEDRMLGMGDKKEVKIAADHPLLTRVRRMHQNDLENIIPFFMLGFIHVMTWYSPYHRSLWHFRIFFVSRVLMSICHYFGIQPFRTIFFMIALGVNVSLGGHILYKVGIYMKYF